MCHMRNMKVSHLWYYDGDVSEVDTIVSRPEQDVGSFLEVKLKQK